MPKYRANIKIQSNPELWSIYLNFCYYRAKFCASIMKIEQVVLNFVFCPSGTVPPPVTKSPLQLSASRQLKNFVLRNENL